MFTLIKREIEDNLIFIIVLLLFTAIGTGIIIQAAYHEGYRPVIMTLKLLNPTMFFAMLAFFAFGAGQMRNDKIKKISSFLSTLAVTRKGILTARIIVGMIAIFVFILPMLITAILLPGTFKARFPADVYNTIAVRMAVYVFLTGLAAYSVGLMTGWNISKVKSILGGIGMAVILITLIFVKGFTAEAAIILLIFITAALVRVWNGFMTTSL